MAYRRKRNPIGDEAIGKGGRAPVKKTRKRKKGELTKKGRQHVIDTFNYKDRVKKMRPFFGEMFKAKSGFDMRRPATWTPAQKAKVTKYYRVMAPRVAGEFVVKRYRRPDKLANAIDQSLQEKQLPGQKAALFNHDPGDTVRIDAVGDDVRVIRQGIATEKIRFDRNAFLDDPEAEVNRALDSTDANVFRILVGGNEQNKALTRSDIVSEIFALISRYSSDNLADNERHFEEWLNGLVAYVGTKRPTLSKLKKQVQKHKALMVIREKERLDGLSRRTKARTRRELMKGRR